MKIVRIRTDGDEIVYGGAEPEGIRVYRGTPFVAWEPTETVVPFEEAHLLAPVFPTKVVGVGRNYVDHAAERSAEVPEEPLIFLKPATSVIGPLASIALPPGVEEVHHEAELAVVIGTVAKNVALEDVGAHVLGYTAANDISARELQDRDGQWARAKGFDTFCPVGPWIETELEYTDTMITCTVNEQMRQMASTRDMIFSVREIIAFISSVMTLEPGDLILTGTPAGVSKLSPGDEVTVEIEGIGSLTNVVRKDEQIKNSET